MTHDLRGASEHADRPPDARSGEPSTHSTFRAKRGTGRARHVAARLQGLYAVAAIVIAVV